ncbi:hypothetical protein PPO43_06460 [Saprospira sp. CCB-QB6]|uniref:hypothetical protein n=1 Tax=Saprospira sp. CCB-QB6 TaxID=3023936 RepID=UPI00234ADEC9|nr:hypothetical protein [Saprospira sp. CCB-QB6]WCL82733.1 hypothetical protein PPO43_06460 [Saprospira sp. CCB-QB6]
MRLYLLLLLLFSSWALQAQQQDSLAICKVLPDYSWEAYAIPEIGYDFYMPLNDSLGNAYHGPSFRFNFYQYSYDDETWGPAYLNMYVRLQRLYETQKGISQQFLWGLGAEFSFETGLYRSFFVPYFGADLGNMGRSDLGNSFQFSPVLGLNIIHNKRVSWRINSRYTFATGEHNSSLSGWTVGSSIQLNFW